MTAFDGPGPFDGDAVYHYLEKMQASPAMVREAVADAFQTILDGGAVQQIPTEMLAMMNLSRPPVYLDVDEAVWAWACAELVALAVGIAPETPIPELFASAGQSLPSPGGLVEKANEALAVVSDPKRSELAGLLRDAKDDSALRRIARLRQALSVS